MEDWIKNNLVLLGVSLAFLFFISLPVNIYATEKILPPLPRPDNFLEINKFQNPNEIDGEIGLEFINYYIINNCLTSSTCLI